MTNSETTVPIDNFTIGSLKVYEDEKLAMLHQLMNERKEHLKELRAADQRAVDAALVAQEKAIIKAENAAERRFELLNELRGGVATKEQVEALDKVVDGLSSRIDRMEGSGKGTSTTIAYLVTAISLAIGVVGVILAFNN